MWKKIKDTNPASWMTENMTTLKDLSLNDLCLLGSHDAAMSVLTQAIDGFSGEKNILTQTLSIGEQLKKGVRYFDLRLAVYQDQGMITIETHHSSKVVLTLGGFGQPFDSFSSNDIINEINAFTKDFPMEIIILKISHTKAFYHDAYIQNRTMGTLDWQELDKALVKIQRLFTRNARTANLINLPFSLLWALNASVIIYFDEYPNNITMSGRPFYFNLNLYDKYSNTSNFDKMFADQNNKMIQYAPSRYFLYSWTLTQLVGNIRDEASKANKKLPLLQEQILRNPLIFPNILYLDNITDLAPVQLAIFISNIGGYDLHALDGKFVTSKEESSKLYFVINGLLHLVNNLVLGLVFNSPTDQQKVFIDDDLIKVLPKDEEITDPILQRNPKSGAIYLIPTRRSPQSKKYWIKSMDDFNKCLFKMSAVKDWGSNEEKRPSGADICYQ